MSNLEQKKKLSVRLNKQEYKHLKRQSTIAGLKMDPFIRSLIMNTNIKSRPPNEYARLLRELSAIGNNINQIAYIANASRNINQAKIDKIHELAKKIWTHVREFG